MFDSTQIKTNGRYFFKGLPLFFRADVKRAVQKVFIYFAWVTLIAAVVEGVSWLLPLGAKKGFDASCQHVWVAYFFQTSFWVWAVFIISRLGYVLYAHIADLGKNAGAKP